MNLIQSNIKTMSSREISNLTGKRHTDVKRDILVMGEQLEIDVSKFASIYLDSQNREQREFLLDQDTTLCLVSGYSAKLRMVIIKRWQELENQSLKPQLPDFTNPVEAARAWADEVEAKLIAQKQLELAAPKVEYFDRVADVGNLMTASVVGKKIGMSAQVLNAHLQEMKVYDKRQKGRVFQQWFIDKGYGELKKTDNGYNQSKFTNKGKQWIIEKFVSEGLI
ncbi:antirepressor [Acinetobacter phage Ab65]|nr:antirepressor [Acinetobacter phage Ab31]WMC00489.1 putative DNA-binding protein [Acinetobacter phage Ab59]WMC00566.1 antirepressor [Acinetobacter phage Ab65]